MASQATYTRKATQKPDEGDVRRIRIELVAADWERAAAVPEAMGEWFPAANIDVAIGPRRSVWIDGAPDHGDRSLVLELIDQTLARGRDRHVGPGKPPGAGAKPRHVGPAPAPSRAAGPDICPRVRLMLAALSHIVTVVRSDGGDPDPVNALDAIVDILNNHGIGPGDVDAVLRKAGGALPPTRYSVRTEIDVQKVSGGFLARGRHVGVDYEAKGPSERAAVAALKATIEAANPEVRIARARKRA